MQENSEKHKLLEIVSSSHCNGEIKKDNLPVVNLVPSANGGWPVIVETEQFSFHQVFIMISHLVVMVTASSFFSFLKNISH